MSSCMRNAWMSMPGTCLSLKHSCVKQLEKRGVSGELERQHKAAALEFARGSNSKTSRLEASRPSQSPALSTTSNTYPVVVIMSKKCKVELRSCCGPTVKPTFTTRVSEAAEFFIAFIRFLSNCPIQFSSVLYEPHRIHRRQCRETCFAFPTIENFQHNFHVFVCIILTSEHKFWQFVRHQFSAIANKLFPEDVAPDNLRTSS